MSLVAIVSKENLVLLRSRRARILLVAYLVLFSLIVLWSWPRGNVLSLAAIASRRMVYVVGLGQLLLLLAVIPGLTAASIVLERGSGALELLQVSRLRPITILAGKWLGCVLFALLLLLSSVPLVTLCFFLGTLDTQLVGWIYVHLATTVLWAGMIGLAVSSLVRTVYASLMASYVLVLATSLLPVVPSLLGAQGLAAAARDLSPPGAMVSLTLPDLWRLAQARSEGPAPMTVYGGFCLASALLAGLIALLQLSRRYQPRVYRRDRLLEARSELLRSRRRRFPFYLIDPQRRRRPIAGWINPVFAKELRSRALGQGATFVRVFYAMLIASLMLTIFSIVYTGSEMIDSIRVLVIAIQVVLIGLLAPPLTAPAISSERERGTLDLLRLTRIGPLELAAGKWYYALLASLCILVAAVPMWFVIFRMQRVPPAALFQAVAVVLAALLSGTLASLFASAVCKRTSTAAGIGYAVTLGVLFGTLLPVALVDSLPDRTTRLLLSFNPVAAAVRSVSLSLFRTVLAPTAWSVATGFLLTAALAFSAGAWMFTARLFRTR